jgi:hypothetical protein
MANAREALEEHSVTPLAMIAGAVVGTLVSMFLAPNIVLPVFWAWPKAKALAAQGQLERPIPAIRFLAAPIFWTAILAILSVVILSLSEPFGGFFLIGLMSGSVNVFQLIRKPNQSMEDDFSATYGGFLKVAALDRQVAALLRVTMNLFEATTMKRPDHAPLALRLEAPRARVRHLSFCFTTAGYFVDLPTAEEHNVLFREAMPKLLESVMSYRGEGAVVEPGESVEVVAGEFNGVLTDTIDQWRKYMTTLQTLMASGQKRPHPDTTTIVCAMLRRAEGGHLGPSDVERLRPLAEWFERTISSVGGSFEQLTSAV